MERNHNDINLVIGSFSPFVSPLKGLFLPAVPFIDIEFVCVRSLFAFFYSFSTLSYKHMDHALWTQRPISRELICLNHLLFFLFFFISRNCNINIEQYCFEFHWNWIWLLNHWKWVCSGMFRLRCCGWSWVIHFVSHCDRCVGQNVSQK